MADKVIAVFGQGTEERARLEEAARKMTELSANGYRYYVDDIYFDFGQNWKWTTVVGDNGDGFGGFQAFYPVEQEEVVLGDVDKGVEMFFANSLLDNRKR